MCGFVQEVKAQPCTFLCEYCSVPKSDEVRVIEEIQVTSVDELIQNISKAADNTPVTLVISADLEPSESIIIPAGKDITLIDDGGNRTITSKASEKQFNVDVGGKLTLACSNTGKLVINGSNVRGQGSGSTGKVIHCKGSFILDGAEISGANSVGNYTGVVYISGKDALFWLKNGEIRKNTINAGSLSSNNATIHVTAGASVEISGGKITENQTEDSDKQRYATAGLFARSNGGAVDIRMTGGEISDNISGSSGDGGGGVWLCGDTWTYGYPSYEVAMTMSGNARIINNTADYAGGGVFVYGNATFTMDSGEISGNTVSNGIGGGVATYDFLKNTGQDDSYITTWEQFVHTEFTMNGGIISNNAAKRADTSSDGGDGGCGGGVYIASNNVKLRGGTIQNNVADRQGGGVYVGSTPYKLFLYDALVTQNSAELLGGGMWLCPTGTAESYVENGGAIFDNSSDGAGDDIASLPKTGGATLSLTNRLLGNWLVHWYEDGLIKDNSGDLGLPEEGAMRYPDTEMVGGIIISTENLALKAIAAREGKAAAIKEAKVTISNNFAPRGGGIGTNGAVIFNQYPVEYPTVDVSVTKKWAENDTEHPESVTVYLYQDGVQIDEKVLNAENHWTFIFQDLPKYQKNALENDPVKTESKYTVEEKKIDGYIRSIETENGNQYAFTITNQKEELQFGNLKVSKIVDGDAGDKSQKFIFTVTLTDGSNAPVSGTYSYTGGNIEGVTAPASGSLTFGADGKASFEISHGQSMIISGLPVGTNYSVAEINHEGYTVTAAGGTVGTIQKDTDSEVAFKNHKNDVGESGDHTVDVAVKKIWKLDSGGTAGESVTVVLFKDGERYDTVVLNSKNGWEHIWHDLSDRHIWTVTEENVSDGFTMSVEQNGYVFTIINDDKEPTAPTNPNKSNDDTPKTGDNSNLLLWVVLLGLSGLGMTTVLVLRKKKKHKPKNSIN